MDTRQGFIDTTQELNVDKGTPTSAGLAQISQTRWRIPAKGDTSAASF
jgi:hypothetical protein